MGNVVEARKGPLTHIRDLFGGILQGRFPEYSRGQIPPELSFPPMRDFFRGVIDGRLLEFTPAQIEQVVNLYLPSEPLIPLSPIKRAVLERSAGYCLQEAIGNIDLRALSGRVVYIPDPANYSFITNWDNFKFWGHSIKAEHMKLFFTDQWATQVHHPIKRRYLSPRKKRRLFTDPETWSNAGIVTTHSRLSRNEPTLSHIDSSSRILYGSDGYYGRFEDFEALVTLAQKNQGKKPDAETLILDIGGKTGRATHDMEMERSNWMATNLTTTPELASYRLRGGRILGFAELMPAWFAKRFDVIVSRNAFRYMDYPHMALLNALHALKPGGVADIIFLDEHSRKDDFDPSLSGLKRLHKQARVPFDLGWFDNLINLGYFEEVGPTSKGKYHLWGRRILVTKNEDLTPEVLESLRSHLEVL